MISLDQFVGPFCAYLLIMFSLLFKHALVSYFGIFVWSLTNLSYFIQNCFALDKTCFLFKFDQDGFYFNDNIKMQIFINTCYFIYIYIYMKCSFYICWDLVLWMTCTIYFKQYTYVSKYHHNFCSHMTHYKLLKIWSKIVYNKLQIRQFLVPCTLKYLSL